MLCPSFIVHDAPPFNRHRADCAVCVADFAPGYSNRCHECDRQNTALVVLCAILAVLLILFIAVVVVSYLLQGFEEGVDGRSSTDNEERRSWRQKLSKVHRSFLKAIPLSAVSIVVVVAQIITQVRAYMEYLISAHAFDVQQRLGAVGEVGKQ